MVEIFEKEYRKRFSIDIFYWIQKDDVPRLL